ncbi:hypothetical protein QEH56_11925 [Pelagicoccus enzymogenes]|uniref:hypothetical protein n=1 Tax=Pelagicoccus enzymogenes TaxID=2773457 RepID=UPI0028105932|nr:hypothetical protein [Pelagicoccus enzymogenes]MDQ8198864.1 hypothetical protein [Pelagicoccus enzymogenes]
MKKVGGFAVLLVGALVLAGVYLWRRDLPETREKPLAYPPANTAPRALEDSSERSRNAEPSNAEQMVSPPTVDAPFWELEEGDVVTDVKHPELLRHYGADTGGGERDLRLVASVLQRFWLHFKDPDLIAVGSNADVLASLAGDNPEGIAFVSRTNKFLDPEGRLLDRWGEPLFFHAESMTRIEIRSNGPDRERYTEDDIVVVASSALPLR